MKCQAEGAPAVAALRKRLSAAMHALAAGRQANPNAPGSLIVEFKAATQGCRRSHKRSGSRPFKLAMALWAASRPLRLAIVTHAAEGGNVSRRRSQRLNQQGRTRQQGRSLEEMLQEREARAAEQQRVQDEDELALLAAIAEEEQGAGKAEEEDGPTPQDQAMRDLVQRLRQWPPEEQQQEQEPPPAEQGPAGDAAASGASAAAAAAAPADTEPAGDDIEEEDPALPPIDVVEADYILEEQMGQLGGPTPPPGMQPPAPSRQAMALLAIMQAGEDVEEAIAQHRDDIDEKMLRLLERRMRAAQQLEQEAQQDVLEGLQLLHRRLKAEIERQQAPPSLRLLDELLNILDPAGTGLTPSSAERAERRRQATVRLRAAFAGGMTAEADVLSLAAQLSGSAGSQLADQLVAEPLDPNRFMADCTELLVAAQEQQRQVAAYLQQLPEVSSGEDEEAAGRAAAQRAHLEGLLQERQAAAALVEESTAALAASSRLDALLAAIQPSPSSEFRRLTIAHFIVGVIKRCFQPHHQVEAFMFGSVPLRAVLPDGDIDISVFAVAEGNGSQSSGSSSTASAAGSEPEGGGGGGAGAAPPPPPAAPLRDTWASQLLRALEREASRPDAAFKIRDVQIIQAEVKLVKCVVADVVVDVSFDTVGGLCTVAFLEAADRRIGRQHLFKRSILLLKAWCYYESRLLGAHHGLISSYALEVLVLYIFNQYHAELHTPLDGPLPLAELHSPRVDLSAMPGGATPLLDDAFMQEVLERYSVAQYLPQHAQHGHHGGHSGQGGAAPPAGSPGGPAGSRPLVAPHFPLKHLNIVDPLLPGNNLGRSVSKASYSRVKKALALGSRTLEEALLRVRRDWLWLQLITSQPWL
ncbi:hypothetical protein COHA_007411 [Chlorella ohadii]|uniref:PAP/OAS1 substrate-binding-related domain-containing protein n=1 Tax=Chlorella ohadii TaxID=2649997 RepID=A0AAD5DKX9_9CHLO|nr:hypothetical protein COHA_007411 [Chlorella ohadii]